MTNDPPQSRHPLLEIIIGNAFLMSAMYLGLALVVETLRHFWHNASLYAFAKRLDDLPGTALHLLGVLPYLRDLVAEERLPVWGLRAIFGATTVAIIFALAFFTGGCLALIRWMLMRRGRGAA